MALVLTMRVGDSVFVKNDRITLIEKVSSDLAVLESKKGEFDIMSNCCEEVLPDVFVQLGSTEYRDDQVKIAIDAPRNWEIVREKLRARA